MQAIGLPQLAEGVERPCFIELNEPGSPIELAAAAAAANRAQVPVIGLRVGALPAGMEALAAALSLTLVEHETSRSTVAVPDLMEARDAISAQVAQSPTAAEVLVGLLRLTTQLDVPDGLVAESLAYSMLLGGPEFAAWRAATPLRAREPDTEPALRLERDDDVLTISLHRPHSHNAFSSSVRDGVVEALLLAELDPTLSVHLRGDGPSFCSGGDLDEFGLARDLSQAHLLRIGQSAGAAVHRLRERVNVELHGWCIGAGIEVPAFAAAVEADADTRIQLPELRMGLIPGAGGTVSLPRRIGRWRTAYMVLSGATIDSGTALRWGIVDCVR
jgi:hypothetical protein